MTDLVTIQEPVTELTVQQSQIEVALSSDSIQADISNEDIALDVTEEVVSLTVQQEPVAVVLEVSRNAEVAVLTTRLDDTGLTGQDNISYIGEAQPGSAESASVWRIKKLIQAPDGDVSVLYANGSATFDQVWDDRLSLSYS
jgi:hypothetical protein